MLRSLVIWSTFIVGAFLLTFISRSPQTLHAQIMQKQRTQPIEINFQANSGYGQFQDVQVPANEITGLRPDGSPAEKEVSTHNGFPLQGSLGLTYQFQGGYADAMVEYTKMWALTGSESAPAASLSRFGAETGVTYGIPFWQLRPFAAGHTGFRRTGFYNVSSGHYYDAAYTRFGLGLETLRGFRILGYYSVAPYTSFAYDGGRGYETGELKDSKLSLNTVGAKFSFHIYRRTWLDLHFEQENARVEIPNVGSYEQFGLNVGPSSNPSRVYDLQTTLITAGFRKAF